MRRAQLRRFAVLVVAVTASTIGVSSAHAASATFSAASSTPVGAGSRGMTALVDLNFDGRKDFVSASGATSNAFSVELNSNGTGTFSRTSLVAAGTVTSVVAGDYDGDGRPDVLVATNSPNRIYLERNVSSTTSTVTFAATAIDVTAAPLDLIMQDFNADGTLDVAYDSAQSGTAANVYVHYGTGSGFAASPSETLAVDCCLGGVRHLAAGDLDADGRPDLVVGTGGRNGIEVFRHPTGSTFGPGVIYDQGTGGTPVLAVADFNNDGKLDVVEAQQLQPGRVRVLLGKGDGTFDAPGNAGGNATTTIDSSSGVTASPLGLTAGDVNDDGSNDVVVAYSDDTLKVFEGTGTGALTQGATIPSSGATAGAGPVSLKLGPVNSDGTLDIVVVAPGGSNAGVVRNTTTTGEPQKNSSLLISEVRPASGLGTSDKEIDIINKAPRPISVGGWTLRSDSRVGPTSITFPQEATIPAGGHYLLARPRSVFSLDGVAHADLLLSPALVGQNFRLQGVASGGDGPDKVGFSGSDDPDPQFRGQPLDPPSNVGTGDFTYVRRFVNGVPVNQLNNATDFKLVATDGDTVSHGTGTILGAPAPFNLRSPRQVNNAIQSNLLDPTKAANVAPNMVYVPPTGTVSAANPGTLKFRRTLVNCFGRTSATPGCVSVAAGTTSSSIPLLKLQLTSLSTYGDTGGATGAAGTTALLRVMPSAASTEPLTGKALSAVSLDAPSLPSGGGLNSVLTVALPSGGLAATTTGTPSSVNVEISMRADQRGNYAFGYNALDDAVPVAVPATEQPAGTDAGTSDPAADRPAEVAAAAADRAPLAQAEAVTGTLTPTGVTATTTVAAAKTAFTTARPVVRLAGGKAKVQVRCAGVTACRGTLKLTSGTGRRAVVVASGSYAVAAGKTASVTVKVTSAGRKALKAKRGRAALRVSLIGPGGASSAKATVR